MFSFLFLFYLFILVIVLFVLQLNYYTCHIYKLLLIMKRFYFLEFCFTTDCTLTTIMMMIRRLRAFSKYDTLIYDPTSGRALYFIPPVPVYTLARRVALENSETRFHVSIPWFNLEGLKWSYHYQNVQVIPLPSSRLSCVRQPAVTFVMQLSDHPCALKKKFHERLLFEDCTIYRVQYR